MSRNPARLLVLLVLILAVFSFPQMIQHAQAQLTGVVCIAPDLPGQTACPASPVDLTGPSTTGPATQIRFQVFIQTTDPMNGFDITLLAPHAVLVPVGVDLSGSILGAGPTVLAECLQGVLVAGSVCQASDTIDTIHLAAVAAPGALPGGTTPAGASGLLFTALYSIVGASSGLTIGYQTNANDGLTNCTETSVPGTCVSISNGTITPVPETAQTGTFTSSSSQPAIQLSPNGASLGQVFRTQPISQSLTATDVGGAYALTGQTDASLTYTTSITGPSGTATGVTASVSPSTFDFNLAPGPNDAIVSISSVAAATLGTWSVSVSGLYHFDPTCAGPGTCTGTESTLVESVTYTFTLVDFTFTASPTLVPFWCPAVAQGSACPAGQSGSSTITVTAQGFTGTVTISTFSVTPTAPALTVGYSPTTIPGASGTSTATFSVGALRPTTVVGAYSVSTRGSGTIGTFTRFITISFVVRPQDFNVTTSNGTPTGPSISFATGSSATDTLTVGSLPSGSSTVNTAGFAGPVTISSTFTGGTGLTVTPASGTVTLVAGQKLTDVVTFSGTVSTTTTFSVTITGTATLATSTPSTQTHSVTYSVTITAVTTTHPTTTTVTCTTPVVINQGSTCNVTVTDTSASGATTPTGTVDLSQNGVTGSFTTCTLAGTTASATCTSTFTATTSGTSSVTASYPGDTGHALSSGTTSIVMNKRTTTTAVSCTTPVAVNQGSTCNVTVTDTSLGTFLAPTGTVALTQTGVTGSFTTCTLSGTTATATCTSTFTASTAGTASVIASYQGDTAHDLSSGTASIVVNQPVHTTTTGVTCNTPVIINQGSTCTVTVTDTSATGATTPTGTVTLTENGVTGSFTTCALAGTTASATCTSTFTASTSGTATVTASYPGVVNQFSPSSGTASIVIHTRPTATTVSCSPASMAPSQASTCTVTVTDLATNPGTRITPTGTVTFSSTGAAGTFTGSPCTLVAGTLGTATCQVTFTGGTGTGTANIVGAYGGDSTHDSSLSTAFPVTIGLAVTTATITCITPVVVNQGSACTVSVTDTSTTGATTPTGTVTLIQTGVTGSFTTCSLSGTTATATCTSTFTATISGTASITVTYSGDTSHGGSQGTTSIVVNPRTTTTAITCTTPVNVNQGSTCDVTVTDTTTAGTFLTPTGTIALSETGVTGSFTTCTLSGTTATATCTSTFTATTGGTASISASYPGDSAHTSSSGTASVVVNTPAAITTISVSCTSPVVANQGSTCTVTVTDTSSTGATTPTGTITLTENGVTGTFTTCTLAGTTASATCTSTFTATTSGTAAVTATYPGDTTHAGSNGSASITINPRTTSTTVSCTSPVNTGQASTCDVTVTDTSTAGTFLPPTGTVALSVTSVTGTFTTCTLAGTTAASACTSTFTPSTSGTATITASYPGDASHAVSSGTASVTVNAPVGVPTVTVNNPTPNPANTGATVTVTFTVSSTATVTGITVNWGDGTTPDTLAGSATSDTHIYTSTGNVMSKTFTVTVTATNSAGPGSGTTTETVNDRPPVASFTFNPASPSAGQTVNFDAASSADPDGTIVSYAWNFGDGNTGTGATTTHVYNPTATATFTVMLTVTDDSGSTGSISHSITVTVAAVTPPVVTITNVLPNPANTGQTVTLTFTVSSTAPVTGITVNWGDGTALDSLPGSAVSDTHLYASAGSFTINVTATNSAGPGSATTTETITTAPLFANFSFTPASPTIGQSVAFTSTVSGGTTPYAYAWNFGDSTTSTVANPTHTYSTAGSFTVTLNVTDSSSPALTQSISHVVVVTQPSGKPDFTISAGATSLTVGGESPLCEGGSTICDDEVSTTITVTSLNGFKGSIHLKGSSSAGGERLTVYCRPRSILVLPGGTATATCTVEAEINPDSPTTFTVTIMGINGTLSHSVTITVVVTHNPVPPSTLQVTPTTAINSRASIPHCAKKDVQLFQRTSQKED